MSERNFSVRLSARVDGYVAAINKAKAETAGFSSQSAKNMAAVGTQMKNVGRSMTRYVTLPLVGLGAGAVLAASNWESSWAGVTKTVDGTAEQMADLEDGLRSMSKELPATHSEIAAVAAAAGQLGVGVEDIEEFTRVMIDLGETTNLSAEEAATSLARFSNIMGTPTSDVRMLADVIVDLGNNSATTEREIVELGTRLAAAGKIAGLSEADVFAFASTLTSVGVEAEAGGTALSKVFTSIRDAVLTGSDELDTFARVAGTTASDFAESFRNDPAAAIASFIDGLGEMNSAGESTTGVFEELSLTDQRLMRALLSAGEAGDLLTDSLNLANTAADEGGASSEEAAVRYETFAAQVGMLRNKVVDLGIDLGQMLLPALQAAADVVGHLVDRFAALPAPIQGAVLVFAGLLAAAGPVLIVLGSMVKNFGLVKGALAALKVAMVGHPILTFAAVAATVGAALWAMAGRADDGKEAVNNLAQAMRDGETAGEGFATWLFGIVKESEPLLKTLSAAGVTTREVTDAATAGGKAWETMAVRLRAGAEAAGLSDLQFQAVIAGLADLPAKADAAADRVGELNRVTGEASAAASVGGEKYVELAGGMDESTVAADSNTEAIDAATEAARKAKQAQQDYIDAILAGVSSMFDYEQSVLDVESGYQAFTTALTEANEKVEVGSLAGAELEQTHRDLRSQEIALAGDVLKSAQAFARERGAVDGSRASAQLQIAELRRQAEKYPWLRDEIGRYISELEKVPGVVATDVNADTMGAALSLAGIDKQMRSLDGRVSTVRIESINRTINYRDDVYRTYGNIPIMKAGGGPVQAGRLYEVGEGNVAEMFMSGGRQYMIPGNDGNIIGGGKLTAAPQQMPAMSGASGAGGNKAGVVVQGDLVTASPRAAVDALEMMMWRAI